MVRNVVSLKGKWDPVRGKWITVTSSVRGAAHVEGDTPEDFIKKAEALAERRGGELCVYGSVVKLS